MHWCQPHPQSCFFVQVAMQDRPVTNEDRVLLAKTVGLPLPAPKNPLQMAAKQMAAMLK